MSHKFVLILNLMPAADSKTLGQAYVFNEERYCLEVNLHISFSSNGIDVDQCLPIQSDADKKVNYDAKRMQHPRL